MLPRHGRVIGMALCAALALLMAAALAAGCGSDPTGEDLPKRELPENATPEKILLESIKATSDVSSYQFLSMLSIIVPPYGTQTASSKTTMTADGSLDVATGDFQATLSVVEMNTSSEVIMSDGRYYIKRGEEWFEFEPDSNQLMPSADVTRETSEYLNSYQTITRLDDEIINGRDCYHISMVPDLAAALEWPEVKDMIRQNGAKKAGHELSEEEFDAAVEEQRALLQTTSAVLEYWIDKEFLVIRRLIHNSDSTIEDEKTKIDVTTKTIKEMDFVKYNVPVDINAPEASMKL